MSEAYDNSESRVLEAIEAFHNGEFPTAAATARFYEIEPRRLQRRLNGQASKSTRNPSNKALDEEQEQAIREYIEQLDSIDMSPTQKMLRGAADYLLAQAHTEASDPPTVSEKWAKRFLERNPQYFKRKQKPLVAVRKNSHSVESLSAYFEAYRAIKMELGIADQDTWNMDETGFRIGCGKAHWVITTDPNRPLLLVDPDNRDYLSSCETINGVGGDIPPMIIVAGVNILEKWGHNDLAEDILLATSESGYSNDNLALEWLQHFDFHSQKTQIGAKRLLIMDGFGSHMTYEFWLYAKNNDIVLFRLPAHSTHLTQPLDVGLFQPFKHYHTEAIDGAVRAGNVEFDKLDFLAAFQKIRSQTFTESTIRSAWKNTGLIPYNPQVVLSKIAAIQASTRSVTPPYQPPVFAHTPHTAEEVIAHGKKLQSTIRNLNIVDEGFQLHVDRFIKGSITSAHTRQLSERDLMATRQEAISKATQKKLSGNVAQKGGVISVKDVRQKAHQRQETEVQKVEKVLFRAQNKEDQRQNFIDRTTTRLFKAYGKQVGPKIRAQKVWKEQQLVLWRSIHNYIENM